MRYLSGKLVGRRRKESITRPNGTVIIPKPKLVALSIVKNESDIIEAFVRHNLQYLDHILLIDNDSTDNTPEIISKLIAEGMSIELKYDGDITHNQSAVMTKGLYKLLEDPTVTHIFPLDADEFILTPDVDELHKALMDLEPEECGKLPWLTFVPDPTDDFSEKHILKRIVHHRSREPELYYKVMIPRSATSFNSVISPGNHSLLHPDGSSFPERVLASVQIAHFPIRSKEQLLSKALLGSWAVRMNPYRKHSEAFHWDEMAQRITHTLEIDKTTLSEIGINYATKKSERIKDLNLIYDPVPVSLDEQLRYADMINVNPLKQIVSFTDRLVSQPVNHPDDYLLKTDVVAIKHGRHGYFGFSLADTVIGRSVDLYGEWGEGEIRLLKDILKKGEVVLDVGANIGTHTIPMAEAVGRKGVVHAFEPQSHVFHLLCANVVLNGLENVFTHKSAVGMKNGFINVPKASLKEKRNIGNTNLEGVLEGEKVPLITIDSLALQSVDLIKVDIEGMESDALSGAEQTIRRFQPVLYVENNIPHRTEKLFELIMSLGYKCWWHLEDYYNKDNYYQQPQNIFDKVGRPEVNILCMPGDKVPPKGLSLIEVTGKFDTFEAALERSG